MEVNVANLPFAHCVSCTTKDFGLVFRASGDDSGSDTVEFVPLAIDGNGIGVFGSDHYPDFLMPSVGSVQLFARYYDRYHDLNGDLDTLMWRVDYPRLDTDSYAGFSFYGSPLKPPHALLYTEPLYYVLDVTPTIGLPNGPTPERASVFGIITDWDNRPLPGLALTLTETGDNAVSDSAGGLAFDSLWPGVYHVVCTDSTGNNIKLQTDTFAVKAGEYLTYHAAQSAPTVLTGRLVNSRDKPLADIRVTADGTGIDAVTDSTGLFSLAPLTVGVFHLTYTNLRGDTVSRDPGIYQTVLADTAEFLIRLYDFYSVGISRRNEASDPVAPAVSKVVTQGSTARAVFVSRTEACAECLLTLRNASGIVLARGRTRHRGPGTYMVDLRATGGEIAPGVHVLTVTCGRERQRTTVGTLP